MSAVQYPNAKCRNIFLFFIFVVIEKENAETVFMFFLGGQPDIVQPYETSVPSPSHLELSSLRNEAYDDEGDNTTLL